MDPLDILALLMRWMHILAAVTAVGGTIFVRFVVLPSQGVLSAEQQQSLHAAMRARWSKIVAGAILFLLVSGLVNFGITVANFTLPRWYHPLFGIKFLLALAIFGIASLLSGKTAAAQKLRANVRFWLNLNIALAVAVICISGFLRTAVKIPKNAAAAAPVPSAPDRAGQAS